METDRFRLLIASYGTDPQNWPSNERDAALEFSASDPTGREIIAEESRLNGLLDAYAPIALPDMAETTVPLPRRLPPQRRRRLAPLAGFERRPADIGASLWPQIAALTMASIIGAMIGWNDPAHLFAEPDTHDSIVLLNPGSPGGEWMP